MEEEINQDLWENEPICNLQTIDNPLRNLETMMSRASKKIAENKPSIKKLREALKQHAEKQEIKNNTPKPELSLKQRYEVAYNKCYNKLSDLRKKEIDSAKISGIFGDSQRDKEFIRQVASLAESTVLLEA